MSECLRVWPSDGGYPVKIVRVVLPVAIAAVIAAVPLLHKVNRVRTVRNLRTVDPNILYRSGQLSPDAFERVVSERGIRTVFSIRNAAISGSEQSDDFERAHCEATGRKFHRLPIPDWEAHGEVIPGDETVRIFLGLLDKPEETPRPMLIHCFAGEHRTGALVALYRMEYDGWRNDEAIEEMTAVGNLRTTYAQSLLLYLGNYTPQRRRAGVPAVGP